MLGLDEDLSARLKVHDSVIDGYDVGSKATLGEKKLTHFEFYPLKMDA